MQIAYWKAETVKNKNVKIRLAHPEDVFVLEMIRKEAILSLASEKMGEKEAFEWANSAAPDRVQRALQEHDVSVAEVEEQVVGWIEFTNNQIEGLYVKPELAGQGIGSVLLSYAEKRIFSNGHGSIRLNASLNAEQFYNHRGYKPVAERSLQYGLPMEKFS